MLAAAIRNFIVLVCVFTVLERMGIQLVSFTMQFSSDNPIEFAEYPENTSKESGKEKDTLQELWIYSRLKSLVDHVPDITSAQKHFISTNISRSYYPAVPTPPPNGMDITSIP